MALVFSPVTQDVIDGPYQPRPRHAFLMLHSGARRSRLDRELEDDVVAALSETGLTAIQATDVAGTGDYLEKIIGLIRGCGLGVALFTEATPAPTLANIFFEVGLTLTFGRPVVLAKTAEATTPSDFVRTEWVARYQDAEQFRANLVETFSRLQTEVATFYRSIAEVAMDAEEVDYELAFERYVQAVLIGGDANDKAQIEKIYEALRGRSSGDERMEAARKRLSTAVGRFVRMTP